MKRAHSPTVCPLFGMAIALAGFACGSPSGNGFGDGGTSSGFGGSSGTGSGGSSSGSGGSSSGTSGSSSGFGGSGSGGDDGGGSSSGSNCAAGAVQFIYVISEMNELYTFDPTKVAQGMGAFTDVGPVTCDTSGVNSMAVDRSAVAYVNFNSGAIFKVTTTAPPTCTPTGFMSGQQGFTADLGMGFVANSKGSMNETLYVSDNGGPEGACSQTTPSMNGCWGLGLGTVDINSWTLTPIGAYTGNAAGYNAELTGTANGDLYGFFTTTPSSYGPIDKTNGHTDTPPPTPEPTVNIANGGYAFSYWGGDFYFYTASNTNNGNTVVSHLQTSNMQITNSPELTFVIVGAGTSTCAPTVQPPAQ